MVRNCYDDQTEILTENRGWQFFKDLLPEDRVATLQDGKIIYELPDGVSISHYSGEMIGFEGEGVDFCVTPDHQMWVSKRRTRKKIWGEFETVLAEDVYGHTLFRVRRDAEWSGQDIGLSENIFEWLGFWFAEGCCDVNSRIIITQFLPDGIKYSRDLFFRAGLKYIELKHGNGINFLLKEEGKIAWKIFNLIETAGKAGVKTIPQEILHAPRPHLQAFLRGFTKGDGYVRKEGTITLYTSSKSLADGLQEIALKAGSTANISMRNRVGKEVVIGTARGKVNYPEYTVTLLCSKKLRPCLRMEKAKTNHLRGWYKKQYCGMVYCVEMKTPVVFVRRKGKSFWCVRTYPELRDTTIKTFLDWFPDPYFGHYRSNPTPDYQMFQRFGDGTTLEAEVLFRALDRPDHVKNLLSLEVTGAWFNEAREIEKIIVETMDGRINQFPAQKDGGATWGGTILDTNPCDTDHWLYKLFVEKLPNDPVLQEYYGYFHQPSGLSDAAENLSNLRDPKYYQKLAIGKDDNFIKVYIHGQYGYVREGKIIYTNYNDLMHCSTTLLEPWRGLHLTLGFDFGLTPACVITQYHPRGNLHVLRELCASEMGLRRFARDVVRPFLVTNFNGYRYVTGCDPSGARRSEVDETKSCYKELKECGFPVKLAYSNALEPRFSSVDNFLTKMIEGKPAFQLDPSCKLLRKGFNGEYKRRKLNVSGSEIYADAPEKNAPSHPHEALQYACMTIERGITPDRSAGSGFHHPTSVLPPARAYY